MAKLDEEGRAEGSENYKDGDEKSPYVPLPGKLKVLPSPPTFFSIFNTAERVPVLKRGGTVPPHRILQPAGGALLRAGAQAGLLARQQKGHRNVL